MTRASARLKVMKLVTEGPPALGAKATGQTRRWMNPQTKIQITQGVGEGRRAQRSP